MIEPKPMYKLKVFGPKSLMKSVIEELYDMDVVHIEEYNKTSDEQPFDIGAPLPINEKYSELLVKIRTLISNLNIKDREVKATVLSPDAIENKTNEIYNKAKSILKKKEYYTKIREFYNKKTIEKSLLALNIEANEGTDYKSYLFYVGFVNAEPDATRHEIDNLSKNNLFYSAKADGVSLIALFADPKKKEKIEKVLGSYEFSPIDSPVVKKAHSELELKPGQRFVRLNYEAHASEEKLKRIELDLNEFRHENSRLLQEFEKKLKIETDKAEAPLKFATTKNTFLIEGYVPKEKRKKLEDTIKKLAGDKVMVEFSKPTGENNVPIAFDHPKIVEPFETFMDLYTLPSYKEIDPTFFMFLTFPIFFGMMLGDIGYGLITLLLFMFIKVKMPGTKNIMNAFIIASLVSIVFGCVFGEFFGYEEFPHQLGKSISESIPESTLKTLHMEPETILAEGHAETIYPLPHLLSRSKQVTDLLGIAVVFGIIHLLIGYIIGFLNVYKNHGLMHAILEKVGWILMMPLFVWLLVNFLNIITGFVAEMLKPLIPSIAVCGILAFIGFIMIAKGEGARGIVELPGLLSNILSYARLMAVGLASVSLAVVINNLAKQMFSAGFVGIVAGIMILLLGHTINIALGILSPFLHSLRLHYVEFFTKFFQGGGKRYNPFGYSK